VVILLYMSLSILGMWNRSWDHQHGSVIFSQGEIVINPHRGRVDPDFLVKSL